jgi:hypothetical protein
MNVSDTHDPHEDRDVGVDPLALPPHIEHRVGNQLLGQIGICGQVHEEIAKPLKVQEMQLSQG